MQLAWAKFRTGTTIHCRLGGTGLTNSLGDVIIGSPENIQVIDTVLAKAGEDSPIGKGLSMAGVIGTLTRRFVGSPAAGKVKAKTGSLENVTSLSGWTTDLLGGDLQFSMLANDIPTESAGTFRERALKTQHLRERLGQARRQSADDEEGARTIIAEVQKALGNFRAGAAVGQLLLHAAQFRKFRQHGAPAQCRNQIGGMAHCRIGGDA